MPNRKNGTSTPVLPGFYCILSRFKTSITGLAANCIVVEFSDSGPPCNGTWKSGNTLENHRQATIVFQYKNGHGLRTKSIFWASSYYSFKKYFQSPIFLLVLLFIRVFCFNTIFILFFRGPLRYKSTLKC